MIISGGVKDSLDGYYLIGNSNLPAIYGQAANFLKQALIDLDTLEKYVDAQLQNLAMAYAYLTDNFWIFEIIQKRKTQMDC